MKACPPFAGCGGTSVALHCVGRRDLRTTRAANVTATRHKTTLRADALLTLWVAAATGIALLFGAADSRAAATSQAVGVAVPLQASARAASNVAARIGAVRAPRGNVAAERDAILALGLTPSPVGLPPLPARGHHNYQTSTVALLSEIRCPQLAVEIERPQVHVKRREAPAVTPAVREFDERVQVATLRDVFTTLTSRRGPPPFAPRRID